jgi:hypothetical protein
MVLQAARLRKAGIVSERGVVYLYTVESAAINATIYLDIMP